MSLREEINKILYKYADSGVLTNYIIKLLEKRIDEIIVSAIDKEHYEGFLTQDDVMIDFQRGYIHALNQVKKLLK